MPIEVLMPALSPTMTEGKLAKWVKKEGDTVKSGDILAEIETDKATMEVEAVDEGRVGKILVPEGTDNVAVNTPIAVLLEEGEDEGALREGGNKPTTAGPTNAVPASEETKGSWLVLEWMVCRCWIWAAAWVHAALPPRVAAPL